MGAAAVPSVVLPFSSASGGIARSKNGKGGQGVGRGGQGCALLHPPSNRALSAIARFNTVMQEEQQQIQQVQGGPTCDKCTAAGRNHNHNLRICPFRQLLPLQVRETSGVRLPALIWALRAIIKWSPFT